MPTLCSHTGSKDNHSVVKEETTGCRDPSDTSNPSPLGRADLLGTNGDREEQLGLVLVLWKGSVTQEEGNRDVHGLDFTQVLVTIGPSHVNLWSGEGSGVDLIVSPVCLLYGTRLWRTSTWTERHTGVGR